MKKNTVKIFKVLRVWQKSNFLFIFVFSLIITFQFESYAKQAANDSWAHSVACVEVVSAGYMHLQPWQRMPRNKP